MGEWGGGGCFRGGGGVAGKPDRAARTAGLSPFAAFPGRPAGPPTPPNPASHPSQAWAELARTANWGVGGRERGVGRGRVVVRGQDRPPSLARSRMAALAVYFFFAALRSRARHPERRRSPQNPRHHTLQARAGSWGGRHTRIGGSGPSPSPPVGRGADGSGREKTPAHAGKASGRGDNRRRRAGALRAFICHAPHPKPAPRRLPCHQTCVGTQCGGWAPRAGPGKKSSPQTAPTAPSGLLPSLLPRGLAHRQGRAHRRAGAGRADAGGGGGGGAHGQGQHGGGWEEGGWVGGEREGRREEKAGVC